MKQKDLLLESVEDFFLLDKGVSYYSKPVFHYGERTL